MFYSTTGIEKNGGQPSIKNSISLKISYIKNIDVLDPFLFI